MSVETWLYLANEYRYRGDNYMADKILMFLDINSDISESIEEKSNA